jgi:hypothetical protein
MPRSSAAIALIASHSMTAMPIQILAISALLFEVPEQLVIDELGMLRVD